MSATGQIEAEESSHIRGSPVCQPLIDAATQDLFRNNAFRITGLTVDATTREVSKQAEKIKIFAELEQDAPTGAAFRIKPSPTLDEIREAIQKLKDPEKRLIDEFFWFWPEKFGQNQSDPAIQALAKGDSKTAIAIWQSKENSATDGVVASHNMALVYHINALDWENYSVKKEVEAERRQKINDYWKQSFKRWERLATDDLLWEMVVARIRQLDEPNLPTGFARRMRATLPEALDRINAELALAFVKSGKIETARLHIQLVRERRLGRDNFEKTAESVLSPARKRIKEQIQQAKQSAQENPTSANEAARILIEHAYPLLEIFELFFGGQEHPQKELFDDVAMTAVDCLVDYQHKTSDNVTFVKLLERALPLAESNEVRQRIEKNIGIGKGNLHQPKLDLAYKLLKSIQDSKKSPSERLGRFNAEVANVLISAMSGLVRGSEEYNQLWDSAAIVLREISLDAWNNHKDRQTAIAAHELATKHATSAELKQRLAEDKKTLQQLRHEVGLTPVASAPALGTLNGIGLKLYGSTDVDPVTGSYLSTYYFVFLYIPIFPICRYRVTSTGNSYRFFGKAPLRSYDKWHRVISIGLAVLLMVLLSSASNTPTPSSSSSYTPPVSQSAPNIFDQFDKNTTPSGSSAYNSGRNTYQVSSAASAELDRDSAAIDLEKAKALKLNKQLEAYNRSYESEKAQADALQSELESLGSEIESDRSTLDRESQSELDDFNDKVNRFNALLQDVRLANANVNQWADAYNYLLEQVRAQNRLVNQLVDSYNAKLQQSGR